jgi:hypothetical protein
MQLGQVLHNSFRSLSENCYSKPATLDQQSDVATLATLLLARPNACRAGGAGSSIGSGDVAHNVEVALNAWLAWFARV